MASDLPYQQTSQLRQLLAERSNAVAYDQATRVESIDKQLEGLGYSGHKQAAKAADAAEARASAADGDDEARQRAPQGRSSRAKQTTDSGKADKQ